MALYISQKTGINSPMILPALLGGLVIFIGSQTILNLFDTFPATPCSNLLVIAVFSSQNHTERRQMIRQTWGSLVDNCQSVLKFVIGDEICSIPPADRVTPYLCVRWTPQLPQSVLTKKINSIKLRTNFEGELSVVSIEPIDCLGCDMVLTENSPLPIFECYSQLDGFVSSSTLDVQLTVLAGLGYYIDDVSRWKNNIQSKSVRTKEWKDAIAELKENLKHEDKSYGDIFWVNQIDTYSALSSKLLSFLDWVSLTGYEYMLKTDDDVFVNLTAVLKELSLGKRDWDWWSCFRKRGWRPPNSGKWRDRLSNSSEYPTFPSGAGYVLRVSSIRRMNKSIVLTAGEDVTVGRMADGKGFTILEESNCYWACGYRSNQLLPCNVPELEPTQMNDTWNSFGK